MNVEEHRPAVSIVLPVRNGHPYIERAINSVLTQTFQSFELLIMDDGSQDATPQLLDAMASSDRRIRVFHLAPEGMRTAVNRGLTEARAEMIARMDADDICFPDRLEKQFDFLTQNGEIAAVGGSAWAMDESDLPLFKITCPTDWTEIQNRLMQGTNCFIHPAMMYRKSAVLEVGGYRDEYPTDDFGLWLRLAQQRQMANLAEPVIYYRVYAATNSIQKHQQQRAATQRILKEAYEARGLGEPPALASDYSPNSVAKIHHHWAMAAVRDEQWAAAKKHAATAVKMAPLDLHAWWTLLKATLRWHGPFARRDPSVS